MRRAKEMFVANAEGRRDVPLRRHC